VALAVLSLGAGAATAQVAESGSTSRPPVFAPSVAFLGSLGTNPERVPDGSTRSSFYAATVELPFQVRAPRWTFDALYRPTYEHYRDDSSLTTLDHTGSFALRGVLSPRTRLSLEGDAYSSNELRGIDATDIVLPRARQVRGELDALLQQQLSTRDTLAFRGRYARLTFPDGELVDSDTLDFSVGYGRALSSRFSATVSGRGRLAEFASDSRARSTTVTVGGRLRTGPHTELEVEGGLLWIQQDFGEGWLVAEQPGFTAAAGITHRLDRVSFRLRGARDMGASSGLGQATLRDRVVGSIGWATNRWSLVGLAGYARNGTLSPTELSSPSVRTLSACGRVAARVNQIVALVGTVSYAHQLGELTDGSPTTDTFRVALGVRLQANGLPMSAAGTRFHFDSITRDARASC
jgi:hypothetical protein